jgi:histone H3/H4
MAKKAATTADVLFVKSKVRDYIKSKDCNTSGDVIDGPALNNAIVGILDKAIGRAKANGRKTVQEKDL